MKRKYKSIKIISIILVISSFITLTGIIFLALYSDKTIDKSYDEELFAMAKTDSFTEYYTDDGADAVSLDEYEPILHSQISLGGKKKSWVRLSDVSENVIDAFICAEDRCFFTHNGVNFRRTIYAALNRVFHFKSTFGASTITQQVVKNISGDNEISVKRKLNEILRAINMEKNHSKSEILELYLNIIPMGENIYGINMASEAYFGKTPSELSATEAATLAAITNAPTRYNPHIHPEECLKKRNDVLYSMLDFGKLSKSKYEVLIDEELGVLPKQNYEEGYSWFIETVNNDVIEDLCNKYSITEAAASAMLYNGGLKIYTTENVAIQEKLEQYFYDSSNFPSQLSDGLDYSMVVVDSRTANLVGIIGACGRKNANRLLNLATAPRTPGSVLKPLALYAPLIDSGEINWATVFDDVPLSFSKSSNGITEYPHNYPAVYDGLITVKDALMKSKNTVALRLYNMLGAENIYRILKKDYGFNSLVRREFQADGSVLSDLAPSPLALGQLTYGVSLRALTEAYTVFPNEGELNNPRSYIAVFDAKGNIILENKSEAKRIISKESAGIMNQLLMKVTDGGTASQIKLKYSIDTAGKTGTSGNDKDRLFIGYTPYLTAGIWCGYRDSDKAVGYLSPTHLKIWDEVMTVLHSDITGSLRDGEIKTFSTKGLVKKQFCKDSGEQFSDICACDPRGSRLDIGYFLPQNAPKKLCERHILVQYDTDAEGIACDNCPEDSVKTVALVLIDNRSFPKEIIITDAQYVARLIDGSKPMPSDYDTPYFKYYIPEGEYVGKSKGKKQYNSFCYIHYE